MTFIMRKCQFQWLRECDSIDSPFYRLERKVLLDELWNIDFKQPQPISNVKWFIANFSFNMVMC